jgi:mRNA-degrading endonuclease RelE of RelBE toxin-antitoxin system
MYSTSTPFFHNIELIIGPGKTELPLERQSNIFSQLYCSLYGWPHFLLVNQTKQPTFTYNSQTLLSQDNLADIDFYSTNLAPGTCLFVPPDWVLGAQLNNSISLVFTLNKIERPNTNDTDYEPLPCTPTGESTLETIEFSISDTFNVTDIGLIVYFYQYLNPPMFDQQYTSETFLNYFREDKNVTQLIMQWTPELIKLIQTKLFKQLDINHDKKFSVDDYFNIKQSNLKQLQNSILDILEKIRQTVLEQYNELSATITKMTEQIANLGFEDNARENLESMMESLPDQVKERLKEKNVNVQELLNKVKEKKPKRPSTDKQRVRDDDSSILFDKNQDEEIMLTVDQDQEEEITAEPNFIENEPHRTDL